MSVREIGSGSRIRAVRILCPRQFDLARRYQHGSLPEFKAFGSAMNRPKKLPTLMVIVPGSSR